METRMKLEDLTYEKLMELSNGEKMYMREQPADELVQIDLERHFDYAKSKILERFGNVTVVIDPDADWYKRVRYEDAKFEQELKEFMERKGAWLHE